ncbi:MAG: response regulator transcription factor [Nibricoccus sp.]
MKYEGKILLVDDEAHVRKFIALILKQLGATSIMEASNGRDAVEVFKSAQPNMVLLDVNMPIQDGIQTLREIRTLSTDCVVVMLTSLANRQTVEEALNLGADNYIRKDTPKDEILASLRATIAECFSAE